jgi:hypothetical protein
VLDCQREGGPCRAAARTTPVVQLSNGPKVVLGGCSRA